MCEYKAVYLWEFCNRPHTHGRRRKSRHFLRFARLQTHPPKSVTAALLTPARLVAEPEGIR
jgi:hypothetical protein